MIAKVIINNVSRYTDNIYHYSIPKKLQTKVRIGSRVEVPFGSRNKKFEAYVLEIIEVSEHKKLKEIYSADDYIYFNNNMAKLIEFVHHRYFSPYVDIVRAVLPKGVSAKYETYIFLESIDEQTIIKATKNSQIRTKIIEELKSNQNQIDLTKLSSTISKKNITSALNFLEKSGIIRREQKKVEGIIEKTVKVATLSIDREKVYEIIDGITKSAPKRALILETLCENERVYVPELLEICETTQQTFNAVCEKGYVKVFEEVVESDGFAGFTFEEKTEVELSTEQKFAVETINNSITKSESETFLIHGVTGSGKTEVYLHLIKSCINLGKQAIFLVPEIALTPQMIKQLVASFGKNVAVMHSKLTLRQRFDEWKRIKNGLASVVVGARSAIFAPCENLGLIIIDEEHETTYKSETNPRYHTVELARFRAKFENSVLVLASATPSLESYYNAKNGVYKLIELKNRINNAPLPEVEIVDMCEELKYGNRSIFSQTLKNEIKQNIENKKQTILFLNKRGYASFVSCRNCGYVAKCPNCKISLTYHKDGNNMICHYCDYKQNSLKVCPQCSSEYIKQFGTGTQRVIDEIDINFSGATYLRMDADTTMARKSHQNILSKFKNENVDILVGTQMVAKGLDFKNVTLVGVLAADMSLFLDDFRAGEKTFSLITQVVGRAGRGDFPGKAIIQTYYPDNDILEYSKNQEYVSFYQSEILMRKEFLYPPFCEIINVVAVSDNEKDGIRVLESFRNSILKSIKSIEYKGFIKVYNISKAPMFIINKKYRYRFMIKCRYSKSLYNEMHKAVKNCFTKNVSLLVDVNPVNMY